MRNNYQYIDPDFTYTDPKTGTLRNLGGIADQDALTFAETAATTKRVGELKAKPIRIKDSGTLLAIHRHIFQDIYDWVGKQRTVEISKDGKQFFPLSHFGNAISYIDNLIAEYWPIDKADKEKSAHKLAEILDAVKFLHPFRFRVCFILVSVFALLFLFFVGPKYTEHGQSYSSCSSLSNRL